MPLKITINKGLFKSIITLMSGTAAAQLIAILLQPVLRRMFLPEDFGAMGVYTSLVLILSSLSTLRYEPAIVQPEQKADAINLFFLAFYINLIFSLLLFLVVIIFLNPLAAFLNLAAGYHWWLLFLPASVLMLGTYQVMNYYLIREKAFGAISVNKGIRRASEGAVQLFGGSIKWPAGLVLGDVAGHLANVMSGFRQMRKASFSFADHSLSLQKKLFRQYADFPLYYMLPMSLNVVCLMAPLLFINKFYSTETAGYFDITRLVLIIPSALLTVSVGQVFLQNISQKKREGLSFMQDFFQLTGILSLLALVMALVLTLAGPQLLAWYAGPSYHIAGQFAQILVWGTFARIIVSPMTMVYIGMRRLKTQAAWQILYFLMIVSLVFFRHLPVMHFLIILTAIEVFAYIINFGLVWRIVRKYHRNLGQQPAADESDNP
ncbi:MAG: oligosaccharide flippase family protein [Bacteroidales bacterium]